MKKNILLVSTVLCMLFSCTKKEEVVSETEQMKQLLSAKMWKLSSTVLITTSGNVNQTIPACRLDNLWEYNSNGNFALYPGSLKCTPTEVTLLGSWQITDSKGLKITTTSGSYTDEIILLEANKLQTKYALGSGAYIDTYIPN
jgi:hypothetical protein